LGIEGGEGGRGREGGGHTRHTRIHERTVMKFGSVLKKKGHDVVRLGAGRDFRFSVFVRGEGGRGGMEGKERTNVGERSGRWAAEQSLDISYARTNLPVGRTIVIGGP